MCTTIEDCLHVGLVRIKFYPQYRIELKQCKACSKWFLVANWEEHSICPYKFIPMSHADIEWVDQIVRNNITQDLTAYTIESGDRVVPILRHS